jgi:hypothetical protein
MRQVLNLNLLRLMSPQATRVVLNLRALVLKVIQNSQKAIKKAHPVVKVMKAPIQMKNLLSN